MAFQGLHTSCVLCCRLSADELRRDLQGGDGALDQTNWLEVEALVAFRDANVDPTGLLRSWRLPSVENAKKNPHFICNWYGVSCTAGGNVNAIELQNTDADRCLWGNKTIGQSIPPQFGSFPQLRRLALGGLGWCGPQVASDVSPASPPTTFGGLIGTIPSTLWQLTRLVLLDLSKNQLSGELPTELGTLTGLKVINLDNNLFTGSFPFVVPSSTPASDAANSTGVPSLTSELVKFTRLANLSLSNNNFTGSIPAGISGVSTLRSLKLSFLPVSGTLPGTIGQLKNLRALEVVNNPMINGTLPGSWGSLTKLQSLVFQNMTVSGNVTKLLSNMRSLRNLQLTNLTLAGTLPPSLGGRNFSYFEASLMPNLSGSIPSALVKQLCTNTSIITLILSGNGLEGPFPTGLGSCAKLKTINLSNNSLSGAFPAASFFAGLKKLATFNVGSNKLSGPVGAGVLTSAAAIQSFDVSKNKLSGAAPVVSCTENVNLTTVSFGGNSLTGNLSALFPSDCIKNLTAVDYSGNKFESKGGEMPAILEDYKGLKELSLEKLGLEGVMVLPKNLTKLKTLKLGGNAFVGTIPSQLLQDAPSLQTLDLSGSSFVGEIPFPVKGYKNFPIMRELRLANNSLSGNISTSFAELKLLRVLDLSGNKFSGAIPPQLTNATQLQHLNLSRNSLTGSLPPQLGNWTFLLSMRLSFNKFSGSIPRQIAPPSLKRMTYLDLSFNNLNGSIPSGFSNAPNTTVYNLSSNNLTGQVPLNSSGYPSLDASELSNNTLLCGGAGYAPCPSGGLSTGAIVGLSIMSVVLFGLFLALLYFIFKEPDRWAGGKMLVFREVHEENEEDGDFTVHDILDSTDRFHKDTKIVRGSLSPLYR